jgi:hypothetical protein
LMAILTGLNNTVISKVCNWMNVGELENCNFTWNEFEAEGYATAFAEDDQNINTFN